MGGITASAKNTELTQDLTAALKTAPAGLPLDGAFTPGTTPENQATIIQSKNPSSPETQVMAVTRQNHQVGMMWSTDQNAIDLRHDAELSMWLYLGKNTEKLRAGDGMALVLQNDRRGLRATPRSSQNPPGETLGVWGVDDDRRQANSAAIASRAILYSWALEFDTFMNTKLADWGQAAAFDAGISDHAHIAANYPGQAKTYQRHDRNFWPARYSYQMNHMGLVTGDQNFLANGNWHHMTLTWDALRSEVTYKFNDKQPSEGIVVPGQEMKTQTFAIDREKIDPDNTGQVRWGFTGATGTAAANQLVVIDRSESMIDASAEAKLTNLSTDTVVQDGQQVKEEDRLRLDYEVDYRDGRRAWRDVAADLRLPDHMTFTSAQVAYADGTEETLDLDAIKQHHLPVKLRTLSRSNPTAKIWLMGQIDEHTKALKIAPQTSTFRGGNQLLTAKTPGFVAFPQLDLALEVTEKNVDVPLGETTVIHGRLQSSDGQALNETETLKVYAQLGRRTVQAASVAADGTFELSPDATDLKLGRNTLKLLAKDAYGNRSADQTVILNVTGSLTFDTVGRQGSFKQTVLTGRAQHIRTNNDWSLQVSDTRQSGSQWKLQAAATPFTTAENDRLDGQLVYRTGHGDLPLTESAVTVERGTTLTDHTVTNVAQTWNARHGLGIRVGAGAQAGDYQTTITWTLADTPE